MKTVALLGIILYSNFVFGQTKKPTRIDTSFINSRTSVWSVRVYGISKYNQFSISDGNTNALFYPDIKLGIGLGFSYRNLALDLAFNISSSNPIHKSENIGFISSLYFNQYLVDAELQFYNHYTISEKDISSGELFSQYRTDINVINTGLNYNYNFNYRKFSFNAPFIGTEIQKHSAGSPLLGVYANYFDLRADSSIFPTIANNEINPQSKFTQVNLASVGITAGYAFTFVLPHHFYITLSLTPKIGVSAGQVKTNSYQDVPLSLTPGILTRNAVGYSGKKFYGFISVLGDYNILRIRAGNDLYYDPVKAKILIGFRFI